MRASRSSSTAMTHHDGVFARENALILHLCRVDDDTASHAPARDLDWSYTLAAACHHGLAPLLHRWLTRCGAADTVPPAVRARVYQDYWSNHFRNRLLLDELDRVQLAAARAGIATIALKGASVARAYHGDPALRPMSDLDLLTREADLDALGNVLAGLGYAEETPSPSYVDESRLSPASREHQWSVQREGTAVVVEYRALLLEPTFWRLFDLDPSLSAALRRNTQLAWQRVESARDNPAAFHLAAEDTLLHVVTHLARHADPRLIWLRDVGLIISSSPELDWAYFCAEVERCRLAGPVWAVLRAAACWTGAAIPRPTEVTLRASLGAQASSLASWECARLHRRFGGLARGDLRSPLSPFWLLAAAVGRLRGWHPRLAAIRWALLPSRAVARRWERPRWANRRYGYLLSVGRRYVLRLASVNPVGRRSSA